MRIGIRSGLAVHKIRVALLLGVMPIALVSRGSDEVFSQSSTRTVAQASLFTTVELHLSGFVESEALGNSGGQQVGDAWIPPAHHALLWHSSAANVVDLHPHGFSYSRALGICGMQQVGVGDGHALLWRGSATSVVDLHPSGFGTSEATGTSGDQQVGSGIPQCCPRGDDWMDAPRHAFLWRGSSSSVVDLHPHGWLDSRASGTDGEEQVGRGSPGNAFVPGGLSPVIHALLWRGSAASVVDLHPRGFIDSVANGTSGGQQVGWGYGPATGGAGHALLWHGTAASVVDLHPQGFSNSEAHGTNGKEQVGWGDEHALLWRGSAAGVVDLHAFLPPGLESSKAWAIDAAGDIVGSAKGPGLSHFHAFLWKRNVPRPANSWAQSAAGCRN